MTKHPSETVIKDFENFEKWGPDMGQIISGSLYYYIRLVYRKKQMQLTDSSTPFKQIATSLGSHY